MKIYDGFLFFNELELLEIRLEELYSIVDNFIICESTKNHQNKEKPLYFLENKHKFSKYLDKIIHHIFDPKECPYDWYIENQQRNELKLANFILNEEDIFLLSDADEIMKSSSVEFIKTNSDKFKNPTTSIMQMSYGYINTVIKEPWHHREWRGTVILPQKYFIQNELNYWRQNKENLKRFENSGWHFSFIGGAERIKNKLESYAHSEFNNSFFTDKSLIEERIKNLKDPLNRNDFLLKLEKDESKFPKSSIKFKNLFLQ